MWAVGEPSYRNPTGLSFSTDGGKTFQPVTGKSSLGWQAACFLDFERGILGGKRGELAQFAQGVLATPKRDWLPGAAARSIARRGDQIWCVGESAQVLVSSDSGLTWRRPLIDLPAEVARVFDFHAVATAGENVWIAGRPGSVVLHSPDNGKTWERQSTPATVAWQGAHFLSKQRGWLVAAHGTIAGTKDGGRSWTIERTGGGQAALLWITAEAGDVPQSVAARYGIEDGLHCVSLSLTRAEESSPTGRALVLEQNAVEGLRWAGCSYAESSPRFPLMRGSVIGSPRELKTLWDRRHEGQAGRELEREIVLALRLWRPRTIVTHSAERASDDPVRGIIARAVGQAFHLAADPKAFPEQIEFLRLAAHQAERLYAMSDSENATVRHRAADLSRRLGQTYGEACRASNALGRQEYQPMENEAGFDLVESRAADAARDRRLVDAAVPAPARRALLPPLDDVTLKQVDSRIRQQRAFLSLARQPGSLAHPDQLLAHLDQTSAAIGPERAGPMMFELGRYYARLGRWDAAEATFSHLLETRPRELFSLEACRWLLAYWVSAEVAQARDHWLVVRERRVEYAQPQADLEPEPIERSTVRDLTTPGAARGTLERAIRLGNQLREVSPAHWADPRVQAILACAYRKLQNVPMFEFHLGQIAQSESAGPWGEVAALERVFIHPEARPSRAMIVCAFADKPFLDGKLDDACWSAGRPVALQGNREGQTGYDTKVTWCHDREFLYLAAECHCPNPENLPAIERRTGHDAPVEEQDHIEICLDIDRDYATYYRLRVDARGQVADDCWHDPKWDPTWYVAVTHDSKGWNMEAAFPMSQLAKGGSGSEDVWAANVARRVPGAGTWAVTPPVARVAEPETFTHVRLLRGRGKDTQAN